MENVFLGLGTPVRWPVAWARKKYIMVFLQNPLRSLRVPANSWEQKAGLFPGASG